MVMGPPGRMAGAAYNPVALIVPTVGLPPGMPLTLHLTPLSVENSTVAVNCWLVAARTDTSFGTTLTTGIAPALEAPRSDAKHTNSVNLTRSHIFKAIVRAE